jgi:hypothetical protein
MVQRQDKQPPVACLKGKNGLCTPRTEDKLSQGMQHALGRTGATRRKKNGRWLIQRKPWRLTGLPVIPLFQHLNRPYRNAHCYGSIGNQPRYTNLPNKSCKPPLRHARAQKTSHSPQAPQGKQYPHRTYGIIQPKPNTHPFYHAFFMQTDYHVSHPGFQSRSCPDAFTLDQHGLLRLRLPAKKQRTQKLTRRNHA